MIKFRGDVNLPFRRIRRTFLLATLAACLLVAPAFAQTTSPSTSPPPATPVALASSQAPAPALDTTVEILDARVEVFFANLAEEEEDVMAADALDDLLASGPLAGSPDRLSLLDSIHDFDDRYGKFVEAELISARGLGDDVVMMHYLYKGMNFPVVWHFTFYRDFQQHSGSENYDHWVVIGVRFDTDLEAMETYDRLR